MLVTFLALATAVGCIDGEAESEAESQADEELTSAEQEVQSADKRGAKLFRNEKFDGNDRTCSTCHRGKHGTISPEEVEDLYAKKPNDALFRSIDSDDGVGNRYDRLREWATIRVTLPLNGDFRPLDDLDATHLVLNRGVPTMNNVALDPVLMYDGRAPDLESQALGAVHDHAENGREPTAAELADIAAFEETLFSDRQLAAYAAGGPAPTLPPGRSPAQKRGREFFLPDGACGNCHSGPMLNETSEFHPFAGPGERFDAVLAGELALQPNPLRDWAVVDPETNEVLVVIPFPFPDPGLAMTTGDSFDVTFFKIPTLWGVSKTAPYFHDASAKNLEELVEHYALFFEVTGFGGHTLTDEDQEDILAYLRML